MKSTKKTKKNDFVWGNKPNRCVTCNKVLPLNIHNVTKNKYAFYPNILLTP